MNGFRIANRIGNEKAILRLWRYQPAAWNRSMVAEVMVSSLRRDTQLFLVLGIIGLLDKCGL